MTNKTLPVTLIVLDSEQSRIGKLLDFDEVLTFLGVASEDPHGWNDILGYWPRYRTPVVSESIDELPISTVGREEAIQAVQDSDSWVVIDLELKRIVTGRDFMPVGRDAAFAMAEAERGKGQFPLSVHLPPWWELHEQVDAGVIDRPRQSPIRIPHVNREVLFGDPLIEDLATRILATVISNRWLHSDAADNKRTRHRFTVEVHRDWLMTPRDDLDGKKPRQLLHGAHDWISRLVAAQQIRFGDGRTIVAAPVDTAGFETAPMGSEEMIVYFDLCRELIEAGWSWCQDNVPAKTSLDVPLDCRPVLIDFLRDVKNDWLTSPFEGSSPPDFIIQCSRRRVPRGVGVPIVGMSEQQAGEHIADCDCPICKMMAEGLFGPSFALLDGHQLDLDDEFAFSMYETREEWEEQQREFAEISARIDARSVERELADGSEMDEFASAWSGKICDDPLPGDPQGHLKLAFLLAEVISILESVGGVREDIRGLNARFSSFRTCDPSQLVEQGRQLCEQLESLAARYPQLVSRAADLQSRIEEQIRTPAGKDGPDMPF